VNLFTSSSRAYVLGLMLSFFFSFCGSLLITEIWVREHVLKSDPFVSYKYLFINGTAKVAAFGDSHVANGLVSTSALDNLGQPADNLSTITQKIKLRIARGGINQVILQADPHMFSTYRIRTGDQGRIANLQGEKSPPLAILRPEYRQFLSKYWFAAISDYLSPQSVESEAKKNEPIIAFDQWNKERAHMVTLVRVQMHAPVSNFKDSKFANEYVETVTNLKEKNIQVCLVGFPLSSEYRRSESIASSFISARNFFSNLGGDLQVPYIDYSNAIQDDGFSDPDHLLPNFAENFTKRVMRDCFGNR
jgi:hypothetical protein